MLRLISYIHHTPDLFLTGFVSDEPKDLKLSLFVDADFAGDTGNARSTSGGFLVLDGPSTFFPLMWLAKRQTSTSRSTTESEVVSLATSLFSEALPAMDLWDKLLGRSVSLTIYEDNQATIKVVLKGYSHKLRHISRTHKVDLSSIKEIIDTDAVEIEYIKTDLQAADIFTKALQPCKWVNALKLLGMRVIKIPHAGK